MLPTLMLVPINVYNEICLHDGLVNLVYKNNVYRNINSSTEKHLQSIISTVKMPIVKNFLLTFYNFKHRIFVDVDMEYKHCKIISLKKENGIF